MKGTNALPLQGTGRQSFSLGYPQGPVSACTRVLQGMAVLSNTGQWHLSQAQTPLWAGILNVKEAHGLCCILHALCNYQVFPRRPAGKRTRRPYSCGDF